MIPNTPVGAISISSSLLIDSDVETEHNRSSASSTTSGADDGSEHEDENRPKRACAGGGRENEDSSPCDSDTDAEHRAFGIQHSHPKLF